MTARAARQRLAAVLAADAAGYTRLMQADQSGTVAALESARNIFRAEVAREGGQIVDTAGDSVLAVFETASGAVRAALAAQRSLARSTCAIAGNEQLRFRIGVHLGELLEQADGSVYGDGVNLAARLQGLADDGGICISAVVADQIAGKVDAQFVDIGTHKVKNVARPLHVYAWGAIVLPSPRGPAPAARKPQVAVGAFDAAGGEAAPALANGVRDGIATALANQTGIELVADPATADYVVNARVQTAGTRYRANLSILERAHGLHFAADRFEGSIEDPFAAQDDLAYRAYNAVRFALHAQEMALVRDREVAMDEDSGALLLRAGSLMFRLSVASYAEARRLLDVVLAHDPDNFMALAMKAQSHLGAAMNGYTALSAEDAEAARSAVRRAVQRNDDSDYVHFVLSTVALFADGDLETAADEARRSLELNPYYAFATTMIGAVAIMQGDAEEGVAACEKVLDSEPRLQFAGWVMQLLALGHFVRGDDARAQDWARRAVRREPEDLGSRILLAASAALAGDTENANAAAAGLRQGWPQFRLADFHGWPFREVRHAERLVQGLRLAGLD